LYKTLPLNYRAKEILQASCAHLTALAVSLQYTVNAAAVIVPIITPSLLCSTTSKHAHNFESRYRQPHSQEFSFLPCYMAIPNSSQIFAYPKTWKSISLCQPSSSAYSFTNNTFSRQQESLFLGIRKNYILRPLYKQPNHVIRQNPVSYPALDKHFKHWAITKLLLAW